MEIKELSSYLGIEADSLDKFKEKFSEKYISKQVYDSDVDDLKKSHGSRLGKLESHAKNAFKDLGVTFGEGELKDKPVEDILAIGAEKVKGTIGSLSEASKGKNADVDKIKGEYESKLNAAYKERDDYKGFFETAKTEKETLSKELSGKLTSYKVNHYVNDTYNQIKFSSTAKPLEMKGFKSNIEEKYEIRMGENDQPEVWLKGKNERVKNTQGFVDFKTILETEAKEASLLESNGARQTPRTPLNPVTPTSGQQGAKERTIRAPMHVPRVL